MYIYISIGRSIFTSMHAATNEWSVASIPSSLSRSLYQRRSSRLPRAFCSISADALFSPPLLHRCSHGSADTAAPTPEASANGTLRAVRAINSSFRLGGLEITSYFYFILFFRFFFFVGYLFSHQSRGLGLNPAILVSTLCRPRASRDRAARIVRARGKCGYCTALYPMQIHYDKNNWMYELAIVASVDRIIWFFQH